MKKSNEMKQILPTHIKFNLFAILLFCCLYATGWAQSAEEKVIVTYEDATEDEKSIPVAFGTQKKEEITSAISTIGGQEMSKTLAPTLSNTLFGRLPGLTVMQGSGEPGYDSPSMLIRGKGTYNNNNFLVFVDGFEASFDQLSVDEIESISVLKDAAALALYGIRAANGAILVTTKRGSIGKTRISLSARTGWQQPTELPEFLGAYDYSRLYNEALQNDGLPARYSDEALAAYQDGSDPFLHPDVDWYDEVLRESAPISDYSLTFSGGSETARYFVLLGHMSNQGLYDNTDPDQKINSNADFKRYNFRSNIDLQLSPVVDASLDFGGRIEDRFFPNFNGAQLWENMAGYPANAYPVRNPDGTWGGNSIYPDNPVASILDRGYTSSHDRNVMATLRLSEKLDFIAQGLRFRQAISVNSWHRGNYNKTKGYSFQELVRGASADGRDSLIYVEQGIDTDFEVNEGGNDQFNRFNIQMALEYGKQFDKHGISALVMYHQDVLDVSGNNVPFANQSIMGRVNYNYNARYYAEFGYAYSGSESFPKGKRFGFFPSLSAAWIVSKEDFLKNSKTLTFLKTRASAGLVGNDRLVGNRFAYTQDYNYSGGYYFGPDVAWSGAIEEGTLANPNITWEKSLKYNLGIEGSLFSKLDFVVDLFFEKRTDVLASANATVPAYVGVDAPFENVGKVNNRGFEVSLTYRDQIGEFGYFINASAFYARNEIKEMNEVVRAEDYLYRTGEAIGQPFGLEAIGFYQQNDFDSNGDLVPGVPVSAFSPVRPGDIRYKDVNGDGLIDDNDEMAIGDPWEPSLTYSFNLGGSYKGFDLELFFQGAANRDVYLNGTYFWAFVDDNNAGTNILNRWTPDNPVSASYPALTTQPNENNYRRSTFWSQSGGFLRLRNIEVGYTLPEQWVSKLGISKTRIFVSGVNLFTWHNVDAVDPENLGGYPVLRSYSLGGRIQF